MRNGASASSPRFAVSIVAKTRDERRLRHGLTIVRADEARLPDDAVKHVVREFVKANPGYEIAGWLCEEIRHG